MNRLLIIFLLTLNACSSRDTNDSIQNTSSAIDSTIVSSHTTTILGEQYKGLGTSEFKLLVLNSKGDTVLNRSDMYYDFEFYDFNDDSLNDIVVHQRSNIPAIQDLFLFDRVKMSFTQVKGFEKFPDPKPIQGTAYYYSYHRSGCADNFWDSDLFYIDKYEALLIGNISGNECEGELGIVVSKIADEEKKVVDKFTLDVLEKYNERKWGFIADYWSRNYSKFIR